MIAVAEVGGKMAPFTLEFFSAGGISKFFFLGELGAVAVVVNSFSFVVPTNVRLRGLVFLTGLPGGVLSPSLDFGLTSDFTLCEVWGLFPKIPVLEKEELVLFSADLSI